MRSVSKPDFKLVTWFAPGSNAKHRGIQPESLSGQTDPISTLAVMSKTSHTTMGGEAARTYTSTICASDVYKHKVRRLVALSSWIRFYYASRRWPEMRRAGKLMQQVAGPGQP